MVARGMGAYIFMTYPTEVNSASVSLTVSGSVEKMLYAKDSL